MNICATSQRQRWRLRSVGSYSSFPPPSLVTTDFPDGGASISRGSWCGDTADDGQLTYNTKKKIAVLLSLRFRGLFFFTNQTETARTNTACQGSTISPWVPQLEKPAFSYSHKRRSSAYVFSFLSLGPWGPGGPPRGTSRRWCCPWSQSPQCPFQDASNMRILMLWCNWPFIL